MSSLKPVATRTSECVHFLPPGETPTVQCPPAGTPRCEENTHRVCRTPRCSGRMPGQRRPGPAVSSPRGGWRRALRRRQPPHRHTGRAQPGPGRSRASEPAGKRPRHKGAVHTTTAPQGVAEKTGVAHREASGCIAPPRPLPSLCPGSLAALGRGVGRHWRASPASSTPWLSPIRNSALHPQIWG